MIIRAYTVYTRTYTFSGNERLKVRRPIFLTNGLKDTFGKVN